MEKELGQTDTPSTSCEQFIDFRPLQMPLAPRQPRGLPSGAHNLRPIRDPFRLSDFFYVVLDPLFNGAGIRANRHT